NRLYPVVYFVGITGNKTIRELASKIDREINDNTLPPMILAFLPGKDTATIKKQIADLDSKIRVRKGFRLRAIAGFREEAPVALLLSLTPETFGTCILTDGFITGDQVKKMINGNSKEILKRTLVIIDAPCHGSFYEGNGNLHIQLRERDIQHEYRVMEGNGGEEWAVKSLDEIMKFTAKRFHK
ncbi:MAG: hypothetical protein Q8867_10615, partial [Bacteroidota bacterium]|nr:hypothetical protein [Bacteroidota bacterium]